MTFPRFVVPALAILVFLTGAAGKPAVTVRFYVEAKALDGDRFASPVKLQYPPRSAYIEKTPMISERQIRSIYPFEARNGSWGCLFKLDPSGTLALATNSMDKRGSSIVAVVGTKQGTRQVIDMLIDKPVGDGVITIQQGLSDAEIAALRKQFSSLDGGKRPR